MVHLDVTIIKLLDGTRTYLHAIIDNYSRRILSWTLESRLGSPGSDNSHVISRDLTSRYLSVVLKTQFLFPTPYFDFSGYSDMARGIGCLLGFEIPMNFTEPYLSRNPAEFWQRWHITLSTWLRDYLFFSLGGGSRGAAWAALSLFITMLLGGLWHGAAWTFVVWGAYSGVLLAGHRVLIPILRKLAPTGRITKGVWTIVCVATFLQLHCFGLIFFRAESIGDAWTIIARLFSQSYLTLWPVFKSTHGACCMALHLAERAVRERLPAVQAFAATVWWAPMLEGLALGALFSLAVAASGFGGEFIYFQF